MNFTMRARGPSAAAQRIGTQVITALRSLAGVGHEASTAVRQTGKWRHTAIMAAVAGAGLLGTVALGGHGAAQASGSFSCGPHTWTYAVTNLDTHNFGGVRCVLYPDGGDPLSFAWYGEGNWGGQTYRHIGKAQSTGDGATATASAADLAGGDDQNVYSGTIAIRVTAWEPGTNLPTEIDVTGAWWEHWSLVPSVAYTQLPQLTYCGNNVDQYLVAPPADHTTVIGLRCVLQLGPGQDTAWYGMGHWGSNNYTHIGIMRGGQSYGEAADLCDPDFGVYCNRVLNYGLAFAHVGPHALAVSGDWDEFWQ